MGQVGQANSVIYLNLCQTPRTSVDETTIGADKDGAYSTDNVTPESDIQSKAAFEAKEDLLSMLPKLNDD